MKNSPSLFKLAMQAKGRMPLIVWVVIMVAAMAYVFILLAMLILHSPCASAADCWRWDCSRGIKQCVRVTCDAKPVPIKPAPKSQRYVELAARDSL